MGLETPNFQYPEDIPHVSGDRGTATLVVRRDTDGALSDAHNDYSMLQTDDLGYLRVVLRPPPTPKFLHLSVVLLGSTTIVAAVPGKKIRVLGYMVTTQTANAAVTVQFRSGLLTPLAEITDIDGNLFAGYAGTLDAPAFETAVGEALVVNLSTVKIVTGHLTYVEV